MIYYFKGDETDMTPKEKVYTAIALTASPLLLAMFVVLKELKNKEIFLYILHRSSDEIIPWLLFFAVFLFISGFAVAVYDKIKRKNLFCGALAVLSVIILLLFGINAFFTPTHKYYSFVSEDKAHHIVVKEESFLLAGYGDIYEMIAPCVMVRLDTYSTDDGYKPFTNNAFYFEWRTDGFILHYDPGLDRAYLEANGYDSVTVSYAK